ncbi:HAMP domain-containing histidine kinase [Pseudomonas fulva]|nr:HAMP domain-containing sensor histidine kinase [Pseudomonas fulva]MBF8778114.1 HAMP domain-containing histidine kinase [Pseudomonas fulva]
MALIKLVRSSSARRFGPRLLHTSPVRLAMTFGLAVVGGLIVLNSAIFLNAASYLEQQGDGIVQGQAQVLAAVPLERLPDRINEAERGDLREVNHFGLFDSKGQWRAGKILHWPNDLPADGRPRALRTSGFQFGARAIGVQLAEGYRLVVAYDAKTLGGLSDIVRNAVAVSSLLAVLLAVVVGVLLGMRPLRRLLRLQQVSARIAAGDLSRRLPLSKAGDELDMLSELVNQMIGQIQELLEEIKSVGDNVAHDLRSPLGSLRAHLLHCLQEWESMDEPTRLLDLEQALKSADALLARFRALQRIAELDSRERYSGMRLCRIDELLEGLAEFHEALAESCNIAFHYRFDEPMEVMADPELIAEAFLNLLDNAFKFTPSGGEVRCALTACAEHIVLALSDTGPGIPATDLSRVTQRKVRGYGVQTCPGSGLGLAIVQAVVRLHGWRLELVNRQGSTGLEVRLVAPRSLPLKA